MTMQPEPDILEEVASAIHGQQSESSWQLERRVLYGLLQHWLSWPVLSEEARAELVADTEHALGSA